MILTEWIDGITALVNREHHPLGEHEKQVFTHRALLHILRGQLHMALQLQALTDASAKVGTDMSALDVSVKALIAMHTDPSQQSAVDAVTAAIGNVDTAITSLNDMVAAIVNPPPPPPPPVPAA